MISCPWSPRGREEKLRYGDDWWRFNVDTLRLISQNGGFMYECSPGFATAEKHGINADATSSGLMYRAEEHAAGQRHYARREDRTII